MTSLKRSLAGLSNLFNFEFYNFRLNLITFQNFKINYKMSKKHHHEEYDQELEELKDRILLEKADWFLNKTIGSSIWENFLKKLKGEEKYHKPTIDYQSMNSSEKTKRVLLALEKVNHANSNAFIEEDHRILTLTRIGLSQRWYYWSLKGINGFWMLSTVLSKNYTRANLVRLGLFTIVNKMYLIPAPHYFKEQFRIRRGLILAEEYLNKEDGDMSKFVNILNPFISHHELQQMSFK